MRRIQYSQWGEDQFIKEFFKDKRYGIYLDIGCFHPVMYSNTCLLHRKGWRGINIDINQTSIDLFNIIRPKDTNLCTTINETKETFKIYYDDPFSPVNTLDKQFYEKLENKFDKEEKELTVESKSMKEILNISKIDGCIDFINLDVEGMDYKILKNIDLKQLKPKLISIETHDVDGSKSKDFESIVKLMKESSFSIYKRVGPTTLFSFSG
ncbi:FkbM family methyltransferase [Pelagibacteraceae bacterium]|nr:FkbM family methyltransferase [Pelagibacteraceae bacterium]